MANIVVLVGRSGVGKKTLANWLKETWGIPIASVYATMSSTNIKSPIVVDADKVAEVKERDDALILTELDDDLECCLDLSELRANDISTCILEPEYVEKLSNDLRNIADVNMYVVYIVANGEEITKRLVKDYSMSDIEHMLEEESVKMAPISKGNLWDAELTTSLGFDIAEVELTKLFSQKFLNLA